MVLVAHIRKKASSEVNKKSRRRGNLSEITLGESTTRLGLRRKEKKATKKSAHIAAWREFYGGPEGSHMQIKNVAAN